VATLVAPVNLTGGAYLTYNGSTTTVPSGSSPRTLMTWLHCSTQSAEAAPFGLGSPEGAGSVFTIRLHPARLYFWGHFADCRTTLSVCTGAWRHVAVTYTGLTLTIYVDGTFVTSCDLSPALNTPSSPKINIGWGGTTTSYSGGLLLWTGSIANARIYDSVSSSTAITVDRANCVSASETVSQTLTSSASQTLTTTASPSSSVCDADTITDAIPRRRAYPRARRAAAH